MKVTVDYFKKSSKWYMDEVIEVPDSMVQEFNKTDDQSEFSYYFRNWFYERAQHDEFYGFVNMPEGSLIEEMLGFPMMVLPRN